MAGVVLLREMMGTRYMIQSLTLRFTNCLDKCKENGYTVDLNGSRLGPDCARIMFKYYADIDFCNSEDEYLDGILKDNCETARMQVEAYPTLDLTKACTVDHYLGLVETLPNGAKYKPIVNMGSIFSKSVLILLIMTRPDIEFDLESCSADIFDFVRDLWISSAEPHDAYYELIVPNITTCFRNEDGRFGCRDYGFMKEHDFIRMRKVLPVEFGNSQIIKLDEDSRVSDEWYAVVEKCLNVFDTATKSRRTPGKTLKDFLTFRED